ncbi:MAG: YihY/virulence factor BrkB family protein [Myxococcota bacterium]
MDEGGTWLKPLRETIEGAIWRQDLTQLPPLRAWPLRVIRLGHALLNDLLEGQLTLRAMSLVYTTLLSLVPLLALSFSVLKGLFGDHNQIEPFLLGLLSPLGERGAAEISEYIILFVDNIRVGILGSLGLAMLLYTAVSLIQKIEGAFNYTWRTRQTRNVGQRFSNYLSVIMVGPLLIFAAIGPTASLASETAAQRLAEWPILGGLIQAAAGQLLPYLLVIVAFTFVYVFVPNAKVRLLPALVGGVVAGVSWEALGFGFASVVASSTRYTAIYSGFAVLILFMIWLYLSWLILLIGARIAFYVQHPGQIRLQGDEHGLSSRGKEQLALLLMTRIARAHLERHPPETLYGLARWCGLEVDRVEGIVDALERRGLLIQVAGPELAYVPGRACEALLVADILGAVRTAEDTPGLGGPHLPGSPGVDAVLASIDRALTEGLPERTLKDLVAREAGTRPAAVPDEADAARSHAS